MTKVLFINPRQPRCGVYQYGVRLCSILRMSSKLQIFYVECPDVIDLGYFYQFDVVIYNIHPGIPNFIQGAPFPVSVKQIAIYHDGHQKEGFDRWLFSDSSAPGYGNTVTIGRPLPEWNICIREPNDPPLIGLSGLVGAWATTMVETVMRDIPEAKIRLHLAASDHCDPSGGLARAVGQKCQEIAGQDRVSVEHDFKTQEELLAWLEGNDMNCYIRTPAACSGISSALDMALAVRRPIAINNHHMFRHIARVTPEICIENSSLRDILAMGNSPLVPHRNRNERQNVMEELENVIQSLFLSNQ